MNTLNRPLFKRYARRPAPQGPVGIMASSPELMQAAAQYNTGGLVDGTSPVNSQDRFDLMNILTRGLGLSNKPLSGHLSDIKSSVTGAEAKVGAATEGINQARGGLNQADSALGNTMQIGIPLNGLPTLEQPMLGNGFGIPGTPGYGNPFFNLGSRREVGPIQFTTNLAEGGPVVGYRKGTVVRPTVDITQEPVEFKETITETETVTEKPMQIAPSTRTRTSIIAPQTGGNEVEEAIKVGEQFEQAGETANVRPELAAAAEAVVNPDKTSSEEATEILSSLGKDVPKGTKGKIDAMKSLISDTFGVDASRYDNLKALNRAAVGFAIAKGDDIAAALESGARGAAAIEQSRLSREDSMSKMALEQVFAEKLAGMRNAAAMAGKASDYTPERLRQRAIEAILRSPDQFDVYNPETNAVDPAKVQQQANILVQSMLQSDGGVDITTPTATGGAPVEVTTQEQYDALPSGTVFIQNGQKRKKP